MIINPDIATLNLVGQYNTSIANGITQSIKNPDALAIWVYLQTQSATYKVRATHLKTHFGLGETRYLRAMKTLAALDLIRYEIVRNAAGQVSDNIIHCSGLPFEMLSTIERGFEAFKNSANTGNPVFTVTGQKNKKKPRNAAKNVASTGNPVFTGTGEKPGTGKTGVVNKDTISLSKRAKKEPEKQTLAVAQKITNVLQQKQIEGVPEAVDPVLCAHIEAGITAEEVIASADWCIRKGIHEFGYVLARAVKRREDAAKVKSLPAVHRPRTNPTKTAESEPWRPAGARSQIAETVLSELKDKYFGDLKMPS